MMFLNERQIGKLWYYTTEVTDYADVFGDPDCDYLQNEESVFMKIREEVRKADFMRESGECEDEDEFECLISSLKKSWSFLYNEDFIKVKDWVAKDARQGRGLR